MIRFNDQEHGRAIADEVGIRHWDASITREEHGKLLGGVIYSDATDASIVMHTAGFTSNWVSRDLLWVCFDYPFGQLLHKATFVRILSSNNRSLEFASKLGFKKVAELADVYTDCSLVILKLNKSECRWLDVDCQARRLMTAARVCSG